MALASHVCARENGKREQFLKRIFLKIMSSCLLPPCGLASATKPICLEKKKLHALPARAQSFRNEGRSGNNMVDANMSVLRQKIEEVRMKERLERYRGHEIGWNNHNYEISKRKEEEEEEDGLWQELVELVGIVGGTIGITISTGTAFLCLFSFLLHFKIHDF